MEINFSMMKIHSRGYVVQCNGDSTQSAPYAALLTFSWVFLSMNRDESSWDHFDGDDPVRCMRAVVDKFDSTESDIKRVYRRLAQRLHPDHGGDAVLFRELERAYQDAIKRLRSRYAGGRRTVFETGPCRNRSDGAKFQPVSFSTITDPGRWRRSLLAITLPAIAFAIIVSWIMATHDNPGRNSIPLALICLFIASILTFFSVPIGMSQLSPEIGFSVMFAELALGMAAIIGGYQNPFIRRTASNFVQGGELSDEGWYWVAWVLFLAVVVVSTAIGCVISWTKDND